MGQDINEYHLTTGFDVSTASYDSRFSVSSQENDPNGLAFNSDGTKMFVSGDGTGDAVNEYTLSTGFDVSTASYDSKFSTLSQDTSSQGLAFSNDGKKMFVAGNTGDDINEYTLSTGFDVSTASFVGSFDVSSQGTQPTGITFNNDGTKMFVTDSSGSLGSHSVDEYTLTTPFSLVDVSGEHTGDVIDSSNTSTRDTDVDVETLTVTAVRLGSSEGSGTAGSVGSALTGTYGQLTLNSNGSYTYVANQTAADALDAGDSVTDSFNYTVSDGTATDTAVITITVLGINDTPTAQNDVGVIVEDGTLTVTNGANATLEWLL
jgi:VCBS repeat-containing protein